MSGDNVASADNQQETLYYFSGFLTGEGSVSIIRATNTKGRPGFYFTPDITISNADIALLRETNRNLGKSSGVISPIKGGYNLSFRGKRKVKDILEFLDRFPPICGNLIQEKLTLMKSAMTILSQKEGRNTRLQEEEKKIERIRMKLKNLKKTGYAKHVPISKSITQKEIGYFLAGVVDAEGSMGLRKCGTYFQPYFSVAMKEKAVIDLFKRFFKIGHIYYRPASNLFHYETGKKADISFLCDTFLRKYPVKIQKNTNRLIKLQRTLNDYTPNPR
jgi:hypothetical protein